jgi:signal transduction histidine kinase
VTGKAGEDPDDLVEDLVPAGPRDEPETPPAAAVLVERIGWLIGLRWLAVGGVVLAVEVARRVFPVELPTTPLYLGVAGLACYNLVLSWLMKRPQAFAVTSRLPLSRTLAKFITPRVLQWRELETEVMRAALFVAAQIVIDLIALAFLVHFAGGLENPFIFFFIFHTVIASIILSRRASYVQAGLAFLLLALVGVGEGCGVLRHYTLNGVWRPEAYRDPLLVGAQLLVLGATLFLAAFMGSTIAYRLRRRERRAAILAAEVARKAQLLEAAYARLENIEQAKSQYMRKVSHELRSPLGTIQTSLKVVLAGTAGEIPGVARDLLERAERRTGELELMTEELLVLARAREAQLPAETSRFDVAEIAAEVVAEVREAAGRAQVTLTLLAPQGAVPFRGDPAGIRQLVRNLVSNAVRYTPPGGRVNVNVILTAKALRFEVEDTGIGIPPEDLHRVFEEFYRAPNARAHAPDGTGLGLAIVKAVVEQHGGTVEAAGGTDGGTRMTVSLPRDGAEPPGR